MGCVGICSFKNGIVPDTRAKMSSLVATPVITVPLHRPQTTADKAWHGKTGRWRNMSNILGVSNHHFMGSIYSMMMNVCNKFGWRLFTKDQTPYLQRQHLYISFSVLKFKMNTEQLNDRWTTITVVLLGNAAHPAKTWIGTFFTQIAAQLCCNLCREGKEMDKRATFYWAVDEENVGDSRLWSLQRDGGEWTL